MKVLFVSSDWGQVDGRWLPGGAGWYRMYLPCKALGENGHQTALVPNLAQRASGELLGVAWDGAQHDGADVVVIQRWMHRDAPDVIRRARAYGQIVVNDVDDWYDGLDPRNRAWTSSHPRANPEANRDHYRQALGASTAITVSTAYLQERLRRLQVPTYVLPNCIDADRWIPVYEANRDRDPGDPLTVGWAGATPWRSGDLETLRGVLGPWMAHNQVGVFHHSGHIEGQPSAFDQLDLGGYSIVSSTSPLVPITDYPKGFSGTFHVGIVPMSDQPFNHAKSWIKGLEYAAAGIPFVASALPEYQALPFGLVARRPKDWKAALTRLLDPEQRRQQVAAARAALPALSVDRRWTDWEALYNHLTG